VERGRSRSGIVFARDGDCGSATPAVFAISTKPEDQLKPGLPPTDRRQLMEYTFADAVTKNGLPFTITLTGVGYNISSVDQVYLPVAMEP